MQLKFLIRFEFSELTNLIKLTFTYTNKGPKFLSAILDYVILDVSVFNFKD